MSVSRRQARACVVVNQLVCPGIGTIMAGRRVIGFVQAALMIGGCALVVIWGLMQLNAAYKYVFEPTATEQQWKAMQPSSWIGVAGFVFCVIAWFWALISSFQILNESRRHQPV